ncbi:MAG: glycosyltransferase [Aggregatilineales bacterium]
MFNLLVLFVSAGLIVIALTTLLNVFMFPRLRAKNPTTLTASPFVSVMIPARNEAKIIGEAINAMLAQDYPNFEVILLDDNSEDGTAEIAKLAGKDDPRLTIMHGQPLPDGWMGKSWACHQMAQTAQGDILLFTDADTRWQPNALTALVAEMTRTRADLYTVWSTQETVTWAERLCVPLMALVVVGYLPIIGTHYIPLSTFGAANGQCMAWRKTAYERIGGHQAVHDNVLEDVTMARLVKGAGLRLRMADAAGLITCQMYTDWRSVRDGFAKNILAGYGSSTALIIATVFHWLIFLFPLMWLMIDFSPLPLLLTLIGLLVRALTAVFTRQRLADALLMPVSVILMTRIALQSLYWQARFGGPEWKGRRITKSTPPTQSKSEGLLHG